MALPAELRALLAEELAEGIAARRSPAFLQVGRDGLVAGSGGALATYGLGTIVPGARAEEVLPVLVGLLPMAGGPLSVPVVTAGATLPFELLLLPGRSADWVVLLDARAEAERGRRLQQAEQERKLRVRAGQGEAGPDETLRLLAELLATMDVAVLERDASAGLLVRGRPPAWLEDLVPGAMAPGSRIELGERFPFLENFLVDAERTWAEGAGARVRSGPWSEIGGDGRERHLEAIAVNVGGRSVLVLDALGGSLGERAALIQRGREALLRSRQDLGEERRGREEMRRERDLADDASRAKSEFLSRMSHELRTPLNSIIGFTNVLMRNRSGRLDATDLLYLQRVQSNGRHLLGVINDLLDLSRIEAGRVVVSIEPVDLAELLRGTLEELEPQARGKGLELRAEVPDGLAPLATDRRLLKQVLINLLGNAIKFTERGAVVARVAAGSDGQPVAIEVIDTGIGIAPERQQAVFAAFEQADRSIAGRYGGTGLGLAIVQSLAELLGVPVELESQPGKGTTFRIRLTGR